MTTEQMIFACPICGAPDGNCRPQPHGKGVAVMSKARAAALAIRYTFQDDAPDDYKTRAAGGNDGE